MTAATSSNLPPPPAYRATPGSILNVDRIFYDQIANAERVLNQSFILPTRSGRAWQVPAGHIVRLSTPEGPQVGDLNLWNLHNPRERFWAARTRQLQASHVSTYDRLWSCLPYLRPMVTIIKDSLGTYGVDRWGGRCHDLLVTGLNDEGKYFMEASPAKAGDFIEFFTEQPLLMALSTCPGGDLSMWGWGEGGGGESGEKKSMADFCRPLKVEIFSLRDAGLLSDWKEPEAPAYKGCHGITLPLGEVKTS
ncbi:MAG: hypothetical protein FE78DRAFT_271730 [Acidomyces sp. 'richmondensis']|nr:MAG: hypothetical protein FE78DRAFT_271730 [Acidomyces sp. 'richmondensis']